MAQKLQTLFDDLADNIERLADYETQANQYGAAEDAFDCIAVIKMRMENLLDDARTAAAHMEDIAESRAWNDDEIEEIAKSALAKLIQILNVEGQIMSSLKTSIEELKAHIAVLVIATHGNGAHDFALDAFEHVKNIEQKIAKVNSIFFEAYDLIDEAKEKLESIQSSDIEVANAPEH